MNKENNILLAEFLSWKKPVIGNGLSRQYDYELPNSIELYGENELHYCSDCGNDLHLLYGCYIEDLRFHNDWNWLMLVVDGIESLKYFTQIDSIGCIISRNNKNIITVNSRSKIEATYNACIQFVKWYNENKK